MRLSARTLSLTPGVLFLMLLAPLAACRHGSDGLTVGTQSSSEAKRLPPDPPTAHLEPPPPRANLLVGRAPAAFHLLPEHRHSGIQSLTHTYHLFAPRHH